MTVDQLKQQGNAAAKAGDFDAAISAYSYAIDIEPQNYTLYSNRANFYFQMKRYEESLQDANKVVEMNAQFAKGYIRKADALVALGKAEEALQAVQDGEKAVPNDASLYQKREQLLGDMQQSMQWQIFGRNEAELRQKMMMNPNINRRMQADPTLFAKMNAIRMSPNFMQAAQADKDVMGVILELMGLGQVMAEQEKKEGCNECKDNCQGGCHDGAAANVYKKANEPKDERTNEYRYADSVKEQGNEFFKQQKYDEAISCYNQAFDIFKNITYLNNVSTALLKYEKYQEAADKAQEAYDYGNENPGSCTFEEKAKALAKKGSALHKMKKYEEAIEVLKQSMLEHRDKATLAILNKVQDDYAAFKKQNAYSPDAAVECKNQGNQFVKENKYLDAIDRFTEGIKHLPVDLMQEADHYIFIALHNNRSLALFKAAQLNPSYDDCQTVLRYDAKNVKALLRKGYIERLRKYYYLSVETYQDVLALDQSNKEALDGYAKTYEKIQYMQSGQMSEADIQEITQIAMSDESMQNLAKDPGMAQMIQAIQTNPTQAQQFLSDPMVGKKLQRLINAGVLRVGGRQ